MALVKNKNYLANIVWSLIILNLVIICVPFVTNGFFKINYLKHFYSVPNFSNFLVGLTGVVANNLIGVIGLLIAVIGKKSLTKDVFLKVLAFFLISILVAMFLL